MNHIKMHNEQPEVTDLGVIGSKLDRENLPKSALLELRKLSSDYFESGNQDQWVAGLASNSEPESSVGGVAQHFGEPRYEVLSRITSAGLKTPSWEAVRLEEFIAAPMSFIAPLNSERIHLFIEPGPNSDFKRLKFKNITHSQALNIVEHLRLLEEENLIATVVESPKLAFHGNILVSFQQDQSTGSNTETTDVVAEFVRGDSLPVSRSSVTPDFSMWQDQYLGTYRYSFSEPEIRQLIHDCLKLLPRLEQGDYEGFRKSYAPGYYEVGIAEDNGVKRAYLYDMKPWSNK